MDSDYRSWHYQFGRLHVTLYDKWMGLHYANRRGAEGWTIGLGFVQLWGWKRPPSPRTRGRGRDEQALV